MRSVNVRDGAKFFGDPLRCGFRARGDEDRVVTSDGAERAVKLSGIDFDRKCVAVAARRVQDDERSADIDADKLPSNRGS